MLRGHARARRPARAAVYAVGVSLGGSALLNWLGRAGARRGAHAARARRRSRRRSTSWPPGIAIGRGVQPHLHAALPAHAEAEGARDGAALSRTCSTAAHRARARTMCEFDDVVTAPLHGFADTDDYWTRASSKPWLAHVARADARAQRAQRPVPARRRRCPAPAEVASAVALEQPAHGRPRRLRDRALPGPHRLAAAAPARLLRPRSVAGDRVATRASDSAHDRMTSLPRSSRPTTSAASSAGRSRPRSCATIGHALGTLARERGRDTIAIGRDGRLSGPGARRRARRRHPRRRRQRRSTSAWSPRR